MSIKLDDLEATAKAATPGPWTLQEESPSMSGQRYTIRQEGAPGIRMSGYVYGHGTGMAEHIVTFDPPTVLALIERVERAEAERDSTVKEMHARELHHFEEEKLRAEAEARIAAALEGHTEKHGERARFAPGSLYLGEPVPTHWEKYVICDYCKTTWPCKTFTALTVESENTE